jgi:hypothetical protein
MESREKHNAKSSRRRSSTRSIGDPNDEGSNKKMCVLPLKDKVGGHWEKLFYNMAVEFYKLDEDLPLDDFLLLPTKAFISYGHSSVPKAIQTVQKVFDSRRYIPEMLR